MDANDLFKKSRARFREMSRRSLVMAVRYRLADWETGVDMPKMFAALSGVSLINGAGISSEQYPGY